MPLEPLNEDDEEIETPRWLMDSAASPEEQLEQAELEHAIEHCLKKLPLEFRVVVVLADIQGLDYAEAARAVGVPVGTIKSRLARARARLQQCLQAFAELLPSAFRLQEEDSL